MKSEKELFLKALHSRVVIELNKMFLSLCEETDADALDIAREIWSVANGNMIKCHKQFPHIGIQQSMNEITIFQNKLQNNSLDEE